TQLTSYLVFVLLLPSPSPSRFPYTTLFRSGTEPNEQARKLSKEKGNIVVENLEDIREEKFDAITLWHVLEHVYEPSLYLDKINRSEEHTSELQSREKLVCRLLLEKKNRILL